MLACRLWGVAMTLPTTAAASLAALAATVHDSAVVTAVVVLSPSLAIQYPGLWGPGLSSMPKWCWTSEAAIVMGISHLLVWTGEPVHQEGSTGALWNMVPATNHIGRIGTPFSSCKTLAIKQGEHCASDSFFCQGPIWERVLVWTATFALKYTNTISPVGSQTLWDLPETGKPLPHDIHNLGALQASVHPGACRW